MACGQLIVHSVAEQTSTCVQLLLASFVTIYHVCIYDNAYDTLTVWLTDKVHTFMSWLHVKQTFTDSRLHPGHARNWSPAPSAANPYRHRAHYGQTWRHPKVFHTGSSNVVKECQFNLKFLPVKTQINIRTARFLQDFVRSENSLCTVVCG